MLERNKCMLLKNLFDPELVNKLDAYNKERDIAISQFHALWENPEFDHEKAHLSLSSYLSSLFTQHKIVEIDTTKSALNNIIHWSSSKFNEYKKSEFVKLVLSKQQRKNSLYTSHTFTSGSYGAGATGNAQSNYRTKGTCGEYVVIAYGLNTYIFDGKTLFGFRSNSEFVAKTSFSLSAAEFKDKLSDASKEFDNLWPVKDIDSKFKD